MKGSQLKELRLARNLNQAELATYLGDCSGATISRWEQSDADVPQWAADKMLANTEITLPLGLLQKLMDHATREGKDFAEILATAIKAYLAQQSITAIKYDFSQTPASKAADLPITEKD